MAKKVLLDSIFTSLKAKFAKQEETIRAGLKYVESIPQIGETFDHRSAKITLPEESAEIIIMYPGKTIEKYQEILSIWFNYIKTDSKPFESFISMLDAVISHWEEGQSVQAPTFDSIRYRLNEIQDIYMKYWRIMEHEEEDYEKILQTDECVDRAFMRLYGPSKEVSYNAVLRKVVGKYRLIQKYPEMNLKRDEKISDRLRSLCITLSHCMDYTSTEEDDEGIDRYRYEANQLLFYLNWYNNLLERDIGFNIIVAKCAAKTIPMKVYPKRGHWVT